MTRAQAMRLLEARACPVCGKSTNKLYGGEGVYVVRCWDCWQYPHPRDERQA